MLSFKAICAKCLAMQIPKDTVPQVSCPVETKPLVPLGLDISDPASEANCCNFPFTNENSDDISNPLVTQRQICCVMETCRRLADAYGLYRWEFWSGQRLNRSRKTIVRLQCWNQQLLGALPFQWCFPPMCNSVDLDLLSWSHEGHWRHHVGDCVPGGKKGSNNVKQCQTFKLRPACMALLGYSVCLFSEKDCRLEMVDFFATEIWSLSGDIDLRGWWLGQAANPGHIICGTCCIIPFGWQTTSKQNNTANTASVGPSDKKEVPQQTKNTCTKVFLRAPPWRCSFDPCCCWRMMFHCLMDAKFPLGWSPACPIMSACLYVICHDMSQ